MRLRPWRPVPGGAACEPPLISELRVGWTGSAEVGRGAQVYWRRPRMRKEAPGRGGELHVMKVSLRLFDLIGWH
jgi:hypothetical protein